MPGFSAFLQLIRAKNLILLGVILFCIKYCLVDPLADLSSVPPCLSNLHWLLLGMATVFIAASGNVINDIMDQDMDRVNRPTKFIVGRSISEPLAWNIYYALTAVGLVCGIWLAELLNSEYHGTVFILCSAGLWFYSQYFKRQALVGNLIVSLLSALVLLLPFFMEYRCVVADPMVASAITDHGGKIIIHWQGFIFVFAGFSFLTTLIREIIKDMQDMSGDSEAGAATLPITIGLKPTKWLAIFLVILLIIAVGWLQFIRSNGGDQLTFYYLLIAVQIPSLVLIVLLSTSHRPQDMKAPSRLVKLIMITGILCMFTLRYSFINA